jgi:hypothetical protein
MHASAFNWIALKSWTHLALKLTAARRLLAYVTWCAVALSRVMLKEVRICLQVYALEIEQYMRDFAQPVFEKAGVDHKVKPQCTAACDGSADVTLLTVHPAPPSHDWSLNNEATRTMP